MLNLIKWLKGIAKMDWFPPYLYRTKTRFEWDSVSNKYYPEFEYNDFGVKLIELPAGLFIFLMLLYNIIAWPIWFVLFVLLGTCSIIYSLATKSWDEFMR